MGVANGLQSGCSSELQSLPMPDLAASQMSRIVSTDLTPGQTLIAPRY